jgi:NAD(P)-dependent dehydrogenase (short-subunit alcohol dehydrogenase family)
MPTSPDNLAIVTGTSSGIGAAAARALLARGWTVVGIARRVAGFEQPRYRHLSADLAATEHLARLDGELTAVIREARWRRIGLVNNAATAEPLGPLERVEPLALNRLHALNLAAPMWLMGLVVRRAPPETPIRIVNVSSGAAVQPFPGLSVYASAKAGLRMAGMVLAAELESPIRPGGPRRDAAILSYEPGIVDTEMQTTARSHSDADFPWVGMFTGFFREKQLVPPEGPAGEIAAFLESRPGAVFTERRFGG